MKGVLMGLVNQILLNSTFLPLRVSNPIQITNNTVVGHNLFYSFSQLSFPSNDSVTFSHNSHIQNIVRCKSDRTWSDVHNISAFRKSGSINAQAPPPKVLVQATSWRRNAQGQVELIAATFPTHTQPQLSCRALSRVQ
ncbi:hypothetical protein [Nostoc sp. FACHB-280]|uniref:hypothetical protein n=1 Tax=Nostoc sp. FACHB-280 TaxID=2692839 RepID=UPI0019A31D85|nr:hypothetical protein [Nostoc sp. FACHB-280]MBD2493904.1 hypothetical protein [Nostoc sp. FACHB-280]